MTRHSLAFGLSLASTAASLWLGACGTSSGGGFSGDDSGSSSSGSGSGTSSGSSGSTSSSGSSSHGGTSSSGSGASSGVSSSGADAHHDALADVAPPPDYDGGPQVCGIQSGAPVCSLKTQTCCITQTLNGSCVDHTAQCPQFTAAISCLGKIDCANANEVCCGVANATDPINPSANTACQAVTPGACAPTQTTATMGAAQLCITSAECPSGVQCIAQTCVNNSNFKLCGLHNMAPFNCVAR